MNTTTSTGKAGAAVRATTEHSEAARADNVLCSPDAAPVDPGHRTIRVISVYVRTPKQWRGDVRMQTNGYQRKSQRHLAPSLSERCRQAAATADLWGLPVGVVTRVRGERA